MGTSRPNTRLDEDTRLFDRTRGRRQVSGLYIIDDQMRVNVYSRANGRNEGVDGWWWFDRGAYAVCLSIGIWYGVRCLVVVAKSVARDIVDEFWRRIRFFFFSKEVEGLLSMNKLRLSSRRELWNIWGTNSTRNVGSIASKTRSND